VARRKRLIDHSSFLSEGPYCSNPKEGPGAIRIMTPAPKPSSSRSARALT